jgi:transcriptional regulator with XRE-family HTH domain
LTSITLDDTVLAMSPKPISLADVLRAEIGRRGWTAYRLAKESGISEPTARRFLAGANDPTLSNIEKVLGALEWTVAPKIGRKS